MMDEGKAACPLHFMDVLDSYVQDAAAEPPDEEQVVMDLNIIMGNVPDLLQGALEVLDRREVKLITTKEHQRQLHIVRGQTGQEYICLSIRDCTCRHFMEQARLAVPRVLCKHIVAVRLARLLDRLVEELIDDDRFSEIVERGMPIKST